MLPSYHPLGTAYAYEAKCSLKPLGPSSRAVHASRPTVGCGLQWAIGQTAAADLPPQNGTLTTKNSPARNLHRLVSAVDFIKVLLQNLSEEPPVSLHTACADAYNKCEALPSLPATRTAMRSAPTCHRAQPVRPVPCPDRTPTPSVPQPKPDPISNLDSNLNPTHTSSLATACLAASSVQKGSLARQHS